MVSIKRTKIFFFLITIALASEYFNAQTVNIKIIKTSYVRGALVPYDLINNQETKGSLAQVHTYVPLFGEEALEPEINLTESNYK
jgi:hypothetical protein